MQQTESSDLSTYFYIGRLSDRAARFQVQQEPLLRGFHLEVFMQGIGVWSNTKTKAFNDIYSEMKDILDVIVATYAFQTQRSISYAFESWVECIGVESKNNMVGWMLRDIEIDIEPIPRRSKLNTPWKKAAIFCRTLPKRGNINHRLAVKDYHQALLDRSDDAFLFAYRSIEDICRSITLADELNANNWKAMHNRLATTKSHIDPLKEVADRIRHGNMGNPGVLQARNQRKALLNIAHDIISRELNITFGI